MEPARQRPLVEVSDLIKNYLLVQKLQKAISDLRSKAKIQEFSERLEGLE